MAHWMDFFRTDLALSEFASAANEIMEDGLRCLANLLTRLRADFVKFFRTSRRTAEISVFSRREPALIELHYTGTDVALSIILTEILLNICFEQIA
jgi:hypothetical protein